MLSTGELIIVLIIVVMVFGSSKIPQLGEAVGKGIRNFKKATQDDAIDVTPPKLDKPGDPPPRG